MVSGFLYSHNSLYFAEVPEMSLQTGESGFTHCDSHCHGVVAVIDGHIILDRENGVTRYDSLSLVEEKGRFYIEPWPIFQLISIEDLWYL